MQGSAHALATALISFNQALACTSERLQMQRRQFEARWADVQTVNARQAQCVYLDVGGRQFHTSWDVLQRHGPHYLSAATSGVFAECPDNNGHTFVDRDPQWFAVVLAYLRDGMLCRPSARSALRSLQREAMFYAVPEFRRQVLLEDCPIAITTKGCHLHVYEPESGGWLPLREPHQADAYAVLERCSQWGNSLVVELCGTDDRPVLRLLDVATWTWKPLPLPGPVAFIYGMAELNGELILLVEWPINTMPAIYDLQILDQPAGAWRRIPLIDDASAPHLVIADNRLAVLYDTSLEPPFKRTFAVHEDGCWKDLPQHPRGTRDSSVTALKDRVVVTELLEEGRLVQQYMYSEARWQVLPMMQEPRADCIVLLWQGKLLVVGGNAEFPCRVEAFDSAAGQWVAWPSLPFAPGGGDVFEEGLLVYGEAQGGDTSVVKYDPQSHSWKPIWRFDKEARGGATSVVKYDPQSHSWRPIWRFDEEVILAELTLPRREVQVTRVTTM